MPKTIQIRDIDDDVYAGLQRRAAVVGVSVPELLRREAKRLAETLSPEEWLARVSSRPMRPSTRDVNDDLDALRGPWPEPDAGR